MERAYGLLAEMKRAGVQPNAHCYNPLIMGFGSQVLLTPCIKCFPCVHADLGDKLSHETLSIIIRRNKSLRGMSAVGPA